MKKIALAISIVLLPASVFADVSIHLTVAGPTSTLYDQSLTVPACPVTTDPATTTVSGKCALEAAAMNPVWSTSGDDLFLTEAGGVQQDAANNHFWGWWQDLAFGQVALNKHELTSGEHLLVAMGVFPLKQIISSNPLVGATTTVTVQEFGFDSSFNAVWNPSSGASVHFGNQTAMSDASGVAEFIATTSDATPIFASKTGFVSSDIATITPALPPPPPPPSPVQIQLDIVTATTTIFSGPVSVAPCTTPNSKTLSVNGFCAFASANVTVDANWSSFGALVNSIGGIAGDANNFWLWFLNGDAAQVGIDSYKLQSGDSVLWAIGREPMKFSVSTTTPIVGSTYTATVLGFDPIAFDFKPVASSTIIGTNLFTDSKGTVTITATSTDTLILSASAQNYLPSASITITALPVVVPPPPVTGGGGGGITHSRLNVPAALSFLSTNQHSDGSFGSSLITDWVAIAFASADPGTAKTKLIQYLKTASPQLTSVTDYERHAMGLESLGINPYTGSPVDTITPIVHAFDGTQVGDPTLDNDDIFALFALLSAGYTPNDDIIKKIATFVVSRQKPDGSWDESPDMTAAALQSIGPLFQIPGVNRALGSSIGYLLSSEKPDGGWGNVDSTSWVQTGINAINDAHPTPESVWTSSLGFFPRDEIAAAQQSDGGVKPPTTDIDTRVWSTAYAVVAAAPKDWFDVLQPFLAPPTDTGISIFSGGSDPYPATGVASQSGVAASTTSATSTVVSTSTLPFVPQVLGESTSTSATTTSETGTTTSPVAKPLPTRKPKKTLVNHVSLPLADTAKHEQTPTEVVPESQTAAVQNANGFFSRLWSAVASWFLKIF